MLYSIPSSKKKTFLFVQGRLAKAKEVLLKVSNTEKEAESRFKDIKSAAGIDENFTGDTIDVPKNKSSGKGVWKELILRPTPTVRWILLAAIGLHFFEHATGIEAVVLYGPRIFKAAGVKAKKKLLLVTVGIGLTKFTFILISTLLMDRVGRRKLLITSTIGVIVALTGLGFCLTVVHHSKDELLWALVLSIVATYVYVAFFNIGIAPVTWVYSSEIFPLRLRAQGMAIGVAVNRLMNAMISMTFLSISNAITIGGSFFLFAGISVVALLFFYFFCPETKGKSLEEIEMLFSREMSPPNNGSGEHDRLSK